MSQVLIIARTRMQQGRICVGGLDLQSGKLIRLAAADGWNLDESAPFRPREIWNLTYTRKRSLTPPHMEDVCVHRMTLASPGVDLSRMLTGHPAVSTGSPRHLMAGALTFGTPRHAGVDAGALAAYIHRRQPRQSCSLAIWRCDRIMTRVKSGSVANPKTYFVGYPPQRGEVSFQAKYTGFEKTPLLIPDGSLVSFSLARWWDPQRRGPQWERCFLQLCDVLWMPS